MFVHRCEFVFDTYERLFEDRCLCEHLAFHYYQPWDQWFCGYHRQYMEYLYSIRDSGWKRWKR